MAKIKSVLRRTYGEYSPSLPQESRIVELGGLTIYPDQNEAEWNSVRILFSQKEFQLEFFLGKQNPDAVPFGLILIRINRQPAKLHYSRFLRQRGRVFTICAAQDAFDFGHHYL